MSETVLKALNVSLLCIDAGLKSIIVIVGLPGVSPRTTSLFNLHILFWSCYFLIHVIFCISDFLTQLIYVSFDPMIQKLTHL